MQIKSKSVRIAIAILFMVAISCLPMVFACNHENTTTVIAIPATCTEAGQKNVVCIDCEKVLENHEIQASGHLLGDYVITEIPSVNKNGLEIRTCETCGFEDSREIICSHDATNYVIVESPTCAETGFAESICEKCHSVVKIEIVNTIDCSYGDWVYTKYATPYESGERCKYCIGCNGEITESYTISMPSESSIYIHGTGVCHNITKSSFTQGAVDTYDIVYTYGFDVNNPFVLGHKYGTMGNLHKTKVGQFIYILMDGVVETYEVVVSEFAMQSSSRTTIIGQTTGHSIWDRFGDKTLHMYTCYGGSGGRWIVLAKLVSSEPIQ